jgi:hypothetical protein
MASWTDVVPELDGDVLNDPAYSSAEVITGFWQTQPDENRPSTQRTEIKIIFTRNTLHLGVVCFDDDPSSIIVADSRRDSPLDDTDSFQFILDTYRDRQNGFVFGTNPAGIEYDGQVTNEGQGSGRFGNRQSSGAGGGFNLNWDGSWEVRTLMADFGWSAEFAIPFRTIRFKDQEEQVWGVNFQRNIRRRNENAFWAPLPRQFNLYRLSMAGTLSGLEIKNPKNLQLTPYGLGEVRYQEETGRRNWLGDAGVDVKYNLTPALTLDGTLNTDFAQVEVDEFQINLDRFNLFFPEKRPFFLENAGFFAVGSPGEIDLFYSRRIGLGPDGEVIPIIAGARMSGKLGSNVNLGLLNMQTREMGGVAPSNNFTVVRVSHEFRRRSYFGGIFTNRQGSGQYASDGDFNRMYAVDGKYGIGEYGEVSGFLSGSNTPGASAGEHAYKFGSQYDSPDWLMSANYSEVAEDFNPEVGFLQRGGGYRKADAMLLYRFRPENLWGLQEVRPHVSYRGYWNLEGFHETGFLHVDNHWEFKSSAEIHTGINFTREGLTDTWEIDDGIWVPAGTYDHIEAQLVANTDRGAWISGSIRSFIGGFYGGDRLNLTPSMRLRIGDRFNTEVSWGYNDITLPGGEFVANLALARISYSFSPQMFVQTLIQYNDRSDLWSANLRFTWLQTASTGLYIVYNDTRGFEHSDIYGERSLVVKYSKLFNLLD